MSVAINLRSLCRHVADERPRTVGEQQRAGFTLLREPSKPTARTTGMGPHWDQVIHEPIYQNLITFLGWMVGQEEMTHNSSFWRRIAFHHPQALWEELLELRAMKQTGRTPDNPAAYLVTLLKNHHQIS